MLMRTMMAPVPLAGAGGDKRNRAAVRDTYRYVPRSTVQVQYWYVPYLRTCVLRSKKTAIAQLQLHTAGTDVIAIPILHAAQTRKPALVEPCLSIAGFRLMRCHIVSVIIRTYCIRARPMKNKQNIIP